MNACPELETLLIGAAERDADALAHLRTCPRCAALAEEHRQLEKDLFRLADPMPPLDFVQSVMARVALEPAPSRVELRTGFTILAVTLIAIATGMTMFTLGAAWGTVIEVGRNQVGVVGATMNSVGNLAAMLNPLIVAYSVQWFGSWNLPLYIMGALFLVGTACWTFIDPAQPVFAEAAEPVPGRTPSLGEAPA